MKSFFILVSALLLQQFCLAQEYAKVLNEKTIYNIEDQKHAEITHEYAIVINSDKGLEFSILHQFIDDFTTVKNVDVVIKDANGKKVKKLSKADGVEMSFNSSYEITDGKHFVIDPEYQQYPFTVEISYTLKMNGFIGLPVWLAQSDFNLTVDNSVLEIIRPKDVVLNIREEHISATSESTNDNGLLVTTYKQSSLPYQDQNLRYKEFYDLQPKVYVSPVNFELDGVPGSMSSWTDFGNWFLQLNSDPYVLSPETKAYLDQLDKQNVKKLIGDIYNFMQDKSRYVSIQLGIGGYKSLPTEIVDTKGYGDCKALTTYMKNLLDYVGVKSNYILVYAGRDVPDIIADFPSNQFNHVFLGIPLKEDTVLLECTSQILPADYIGKFTDDRNVLWIAKDKSKIIRSRRYAMDDNVQMNEATINLNSYGDGTLKLRTSNSGIFFDDFQLYKIAPEDYIKKANIAEFHYYKDFNIKNFTFAQSDENVAAFSTSFDLEVNSIARVVGDKLILNANLLKPVTDYLDYDEFMNFADVSRGFTVKDRVEINFEGKFWAQKMPDEISISTEFGTYNLSFAVDSDKLVITREIRVEKGTYTKDDFGKFKEFVTGMKAADLKKFVLNSKT